MRARRSMRSLLVWLAIGLAAACEDPPAVLNAAEQGITVSNQPGHFHITIHWLDNVIDDTSFTWVSLDSQAKIEHNSLVVHGSGHVNVFDAHGVLVATSPFVYEADSLSAKGAPGNWTIQFQFLAATGSVDVLVEQP